MIYFDISKFDYVYLCNASTLNGGEVFEDNTSSASSFTDNNHVHLASTNNDMTGMTLYVGCSANRFGRVQWMYDVSTSALWNVQYASTKSPCWAMVPGATGSRGFFEAHTGLRSTWEPYATCSIQDPDLWRDDWATYTVNSKSAYWMRFVCQEGIKAVTPSLCGIRPSLTLPEPVSMEDSFELFGGEHVTLDGKRSFDEIATFKNHTAQWSGLDRPDYQSAQELWTTGSFYMRLDWDDAINAGGRATCSACMRIDKAAGMKAGRTPNCNGLRYDVQIDILEIEG